MKDMACRSLLLKLERRGYLVLPPRKAPSVNHFRNRSISDIEHDSSIIAASLSTIRPVKISLVQTSADKALFSCLLNRYHYLGYKGIVGENLKYLVFGVDGRPLGCFLFGSAAWKTESRDNYIGWDSKTRQQNLHYVTNNMRFLILPWVKVPHLASHILSQVVRRISDDWQVKYHHPIHLLETFVDLSRFKGTCYQAANWLHVGRTKGRTRNDRNHCCSVPVKAVYLYPLQREFRSILCKCRGQ